MRSESENEELSAAEARQLARQLIKAANYRAYRQSGAGRATKRRERVKLARIPAPRGGIAERTR